MSRRKGWVRESERHSLAARGIKTGRRSRRRLPSASRLGNTINKSYRPLRPLLCYVGGKTKLIKTIRPKIPPHTTYIEPFVGGGSIFFDKEPAEKNIIADKNKDVTNFYKRFRNMPAREIRKFKCPINKVQFAKAVKNQSRSAEAFLGVNKRCYGGKMDKPSFTPNLRGNNIQPSEEGISNLKKNVEAYQDKLNATKILNEDYKVVMKKYDNKNSLAFLDPPYYASYNYGFETQVQPKEICDIAKYAKGKVLISYNNVPEVRAAAKGLNVKKVKTNYEMQRSITGGVKPKTELLIANYSLNGVENKNNSIKI